MIEDDIKKVREAEVSALKRIQEAEIKSKEKVEEAKKEIREEIERKRAELLQEIENWKTAAEMEGKMRADEILSEYSEKVEKIKEIDEARIKEVSQEVLTSFLR